MAGAFFGALWFLSRLANLYGLRYTNHMDSNIQTELAKLTELITQAIPVEQIFLFGSYAYGKPHKDSDLDLYVVLRDDYPLRGIDTLRVTL